MNRSERPTRSVLVKYPSLGTALAMDIAGFTAFTTRHDPDVNGISNFPKTGRSKFPSLAGSVVSRFRDVQLRSLVGDRGALALVAV